MCRVRCRQLPGQGLRAYAYEWILGGRVSGDGEDDENVEMRIETHKIMEVHHLLLIQSVKGDKHRCPLHFHLFSSLSFLPTTHIGF